MTPVRLSQVPDNPGVSATRPRWWVCLLWSGLGCCLAGCWPCDGGQRALQVDEPFPHTRCLAAEPAPAQRWQVGDIAVAREGRTLTLEGAPDSVRIAAFSGPGLAAAPSAEVLAAVVERKPDLAVMLGGLGDDDTTATQTMRLFGEAPFLTLFVPGGRDQWGRVTALLAQQPQPVRERFVEVASIRSVRVAGAELVPIAGADDGRYALNIDSCGFALPDLQALAHDLSAPSGRRYLLAWQAPGRGGQLAVARSHGLDLGSESMAELAARTGAPGGLFAWPRVRVDQPVVGGGKRPATPGKPAGDLQLIVPRLTGPGLLRDDGTRVPAGFDMLTLGADGLSYLGRVEAGG